MPYSRYVVEVCKDCGHSAGAHGFPSDNCREKDCFCSKYRKCKVMRVRLTG